MRVFKFIFGRFSIILLLVIAQMVFFISLFTFLEKLSPYYVPINAAISVLGVLLVIVLINRQTNPNYIIPWIVVILLMPLLGIVVYLMFSQNRLSNRQKKIYRESQGKVFDYAPQDELTKQKLMQEDEHMHGQSEYLLKANKLPVYNNTYAEYFATGEDFFKALKQEIIKAERFIFMEFFIVAKGNMWDSLLNLLLEKIEQGVEVRFMYDDIGSISTLKSGYCKKLRGLGIKCVKFNRFLPIMSAVHNNRDHRKIVVIDGKTGFTTGINIADEYINEKEMFGYWKDSGIMLKGEAVKNFTVMFLEGFNAQSKTKEDFSPFLPKFIDTGANRNAEKGEKSADLGYIQPFADGPVPLYLEKISQNAILNLVNQSKHYVYITTPYLIIDFQVMEALKLAARRGVDVRIVTPRIPDKKMIFLMTKASCRPLIESGVKIFEYTPGFMHSKNILCDGKAAVVGTINLDYRSLVHHFECGVWMYNAPCLKQIKQDFDNIFEVSRQISYEESKLKFFPKLIKNVLQLFSPLM